MDVFSSLLLLFSSTLQYVKVAVVDTGLDLADIRFAGVLCPEGHKDFTSKGIKDKHGHGTHVAGIITNYADVPNYCLVIVKYYGGKNNNYYEALKYAVSLTPNIINFSGGGTGKNPKEKELIKKHPEILFIVAAGNDKVDLDTNCYYHPACYNYKNVISVGSVAEDGTISKFSNYGDRVKMWEKGEDVLSFYPNNQERRLSGTSMATAKVTARYIKRMLGNE